MPQAVTKLPVKNALTIDLAGRRRSWLHSSYHDSVWIVSDSLGEGRRVTWNFDIPMADGRSLLLYPDLLATAKEFIFWIRASTYGSIDDANTHKRYANTILRICYGLTARGFNSFSQLSTFDVDKICRDAAFGVDGITGISQMLRNHLGLFENWADVPASLIKKPHVLDVDATTAAYNLPSNWARKEARSEIIVATARLNGKLLTSHCKQGVESRCCNSNILGNNWLFFG